MKAYARLKEILEFWPLLVSAVLGYLSVDYYIIPFLKGVGLSGYALFICSSVVATGKLTYWYWFWGWLRRKIIATKSVQDDIKFGKVIGNELKISGYFDRIKRYFMRKYYWAIDEKGLVVRFITWGGYFSLITIGISPEPFTRHCAIVFCSAFSWKRGFIVLAFANIFHIAYVVYGWEYIFSLFRK